MLDVAEEERQVGEGDRAPDAVAAGHDEHAEGGGEHHLQLDAGGLEADEVGEGAGGVGGEHLERQVEQRVEPVGDGVDEQQQAEREERGAEETGAAEPEGGSGTVGKQGHAGVEDADARAEEEEQQHGRAEQAGAGDAEEQERESPAAGAGGPANASPGGNHSEQTEEREEGADGAEGVARPESPGGGPDGQQGQAAEGDQGADGKDSRRGVALRKMPLRAGARLEGRKRCGSRAAAAVREPSVLPSCVCSMARPFSDWSEARGT